MTKTIERREEERYPIQDIYRKYVSCRLYSDDNMHHDAELIEFSKNGLKMLCGEHKEENSEMDCVISLPKLYPKDLKTRIRIRYSRPSDNDGEYIIGAMIVKADKNYIARVFAKIIEFVTSRTGDIF